MPREPCRRGPSSRRALPSDAASPPRLPRRREDQAHAGLAAVEIRRAAVRVGTPVRGRIAVEHVGCVGRVLAAVAAVALRVVARGRETADGLAAGRRASCPSSWPPTSRSWRWAAPRPRCRGSSRGTRPSRCLPPERARAARSTRRAGFPRRPGARPPGCGGSPATIGPSSVELGSATSSAVTTSGTSAVSEPSSRVSASSSPSSAPCISPTSAKRSSGRLASARATIASTPSETSGRRDCTLGTGARRCCSAISTNEAPR